MPRFVNAVTALATLLVAPLLVASTSRADDEPRDDADLLAQPGVVSAEFVFEEAPHPQCHASTLVETPRGLVAAWFGGTAEKHDDVGIWVARHVEGKWTRPERVADGSEGEEKDFPCWNPVLFQPKDGPLFLFYKVGPSPDTWWGVLLVSTDAGVTWQDRSRLGTDPAIGHLLGPVKNKPVQLADGSILCPSSTEHDGWRVHFERSADLGRTWQVVGPIEDASTFNAIQPSILVHRDGTLRILCRTREGVVATSRSTDGGNTWSALAATTLPNPNSGTDAVTLADGRHLLVYNHTTRSRGFPSNRNMLNVAIGDDEGNWRQVAILERGPGEFSYPAVIQSPDGKVHVTYTWQRRRVKHVVLDPATLAAE